MRATQIRPRITRLSARDSGAELELLCGGCEHRFLSHQYFVCGVPIGTHHCPQCEQVGDVYPELYEAALHQFLPPRATRSTDFPDLRFAAAPPKAIVRRPKKAGSSIVVLYAPAHPVQGFLYHAEIARRSLALQRRLMSLSEVAESTGFKLWFRPDSEERNARTTLVDEETLRSCFSDWVKGCGVPAPHFVEDSIENALSETDLLLTHVGAPWIDAALSAGIDVMVLPFLPGAEGERVAPGAIHVRDSQVEATVIDWVSKNQTTETVQPITKIEPAGSQFKVLFAYRHDVDISGGAGIVLSETRKSLEDLGHQVDVTFESHPNATGYDLVHCFNVWSPATALEQLRHIHGQGVPIVWSPIYLELSEFIWTTSLLAALRDQSEAKQVEFWDIIENGNAVINGLSRWAPNEVHEGFYDQLKEMLSLVDHVCVTSQSEIKSIYQRTLSASIPFSVVPHGVHVEQFRNATAELFVQEFGVRDFVLCIGTFERRKNQKMILEALKDEDLELVFIGPNFDEDYIGICDNVIGKRVHLLGRQPVEMVASALKAASVHVLPSFAEGAALANLEAAIAECPMVVSNRSSEFEYFADGVYYCDPTNRASIRNAVRQAIAETKEREHARAYLADRIESVCSWKRAAELTELIYQSLTVAL